jgi:hypothetical protein
MVGNNKKKMVVSITLNSLSAIMVVIFTGVGIQRKPLTFYK